MTVGGDGSQRPGVGDGAPRAAHHSGGSAERCAAKVSL